MDVPAGRRCFRHKCLSINDLSPIRRRPNHLKLLCQMPISAAIRSANLLSPNFPVAFCALCGIILHEHPFPSERALSVSQSAKASRSEKERISGLRRRSPSAACNRERLIIAVQGVFPSGRTQAARQFSLRSKLSQRRTSRGEHYEILFRIELCKDGKEATKTRSGISSELFLLEKENMRNEKTRLYTD